MHADRSKRDADFGAPAAGTSVAIAGAVGNVPTGPVEKVPFSSEEPSRPSGPRFPRPHLQRIETEPPPAPVKQRLANGTITPALAEGTYDGFVDDDKTPLGTLEWD